MTTSITGVAGTTILRNYVGPAAGETVTAASVNVLGGGLANAIERKFSYPNGPYVLGSPWYVTTGVGTAVASPAGVTVKADFGGAIMLTELAHETVIDGFTVRIDPGVHGGSWPPAGAPTLTLYKINATTGASTTVETVTDSLAVQATYEAAHDFVIVVSPTLALDRSTYLYYVVFVQENGANAVDGTIMGARVNIVSQ